MDSVTDLSITVKVDTVPARREIADFQRYAMQVLEEIRSAYASLSPIIQQDGMTGPGESRRRV